LSGAIDVVTSDLSNDFDNSAEALLAFDDVLKTFRVAAGLPKLTPPPQDALTPSSFDEFLLVAAERVVAPRLEAVLAATTFTPLAATNFERAARTVAARVAALARRPVRDKFARLNALLAFLTIDKVRVGGVSNFIWGGASVIFDLDSCQTFTNASQPPQALRSGRRTSAGRWRGGKTSRANEFRRCGSEAKRAFCLYFRQGVVQ
jgi:hypothetical protein